MKVILFQALESLGRPGDIVEVKPGYYRNFLGPRGLADMATPANLKRLAAKRRVLEALAASELSGAQQRAEELKGIVLTFRMRANDKGQLFGSVGVADVDRALREQNLEIPRRNILLPGALKTVGEHEAGLRLHPEVTAAIKVVIEAGEE